jgi:hypothetical protein
MRADIPTGRSAAAEFRRDPGGIQPTAADNLFLLVNSTYPFEAERVRPPCEPRFCDVA